MQWKQQDLDKRIGSSNMLVRTIVLQVKINLMLTLLTFFSIIGIEMKLSRHMLKYLIIYYLPSGTILIELALS